MPKPTKIDAEQGDLMEGRAVELTNGEYHEYPQAQNAGNDMKRRMLWIEDAKGIRHEWAYDDVEGFGSITFMRKNRKRR
jgi:hypothetical protein